jgi:hypothetical protein
MEKTGFGESLLGRAARRQPAVDVDQSRTVGYRHVELTHRRSPSKNLRRRFQEQIDKSRIADVRPHLAE